MADPLSGRSLRGSYFHDEWELRITERCLSEDFGVDPGTPFEELAGREIVKAFIKDRSAYAIGSKLVGEEAGAETLYRLAYGDDHRGATWWDEERRVVWLCAYDPNHKAGKTFTEIFPALMKDGRMKPSDADRERLDDDRDEIFLDRLEADAQELLAEARQALGEERRGLIGGASTVGVLVEVVETLEETYIAISLSDLRFNNTMVTFILAAFFPGDFSEWQMADELPTRPRNEEAHEVVYRHLHEH